MRIGTLTLVVAAILCGQTMSAQRGGGPAPSSRPAPTVLHLGSFAVTVQDLDRSCTIPRAFRCC